MLEIETRDPAAHAASLLALADRYRAQARTLHGDDRRDARTAAAELTAWANEERQRSAPVGQRHQSRQQVSCSGERVPVSDRGIPLGEHHHRAKLPDAVVVQIRDLREHENMTIAEIARRLSLPVGTVHAIAYYRRRATLPADWRRVP